VGVAAVEPASREAMLPARDRVLPEINESLHNKCDLTLTKNGCPSSTSDGGKTRRASPLMLGNEMSWQDQGNSLILKCSIDEMEGNDHFLTIQHSISVDVRQFPDLNTNYTYIDYMTDLSQDNSWQSRLEKNRSHFISTQFIVDWTETLENGLLIDREREVAAME
jgi:hypothetical protein